MERLFLESLAEMSGGAAQAAPRRTSADAAEANRTRGLEERRLDHQGYVLAPQEFELTPPRVAWAQKVRDAAIVAGIDPHLFESQIRNESWGYDEDVIYSRGEYDVRPDKPHKGNSAGARGIAQIVPSAHPGVDYENADEALAYATNLTKGHLQTYHGDWGRALVAYNAGAGSLTFDAYSRNDDDWSNPDNYSETKNYLRRVIGRLR